jgi:hypothetical protein
MKFKVRHLQSFVVIYLFCLLAALPVFAAEPSTSTSVSEEFLFFRNEGGYSPFKFVEVLIRSDGSGVTTFDRRNKDKGESSFNLNRYEVETLKTLVHAVDFFAQPDKDKRFASDVGQSILRISLESKKRELLFEFRPELEPLTSCLWKLIYQGIILTDLKNKSDVYSALGAVSNYLASAKVFQPKVLREPLEKFISNSDDRQQLLWAIEALSWVMTPEEWMGFLSKELNDAKEARKVLILEALTSHPFTGNIPHAHRDMLRPLFLRYLRLEYRNWSQFTKEKRQAYGSVIRFLGEQRYTIATSILVEMIEECYTANDSWLGWSLPQMAGEAIEPLKLLLDSPNANIRAPAAEMLGKILVMDQPPPNNTIQEPERKQILSCLKTTVAPILEKLSKDDPDDWVRKAAKRSLEQIERGWYK